MGLGDDYRNILDQLQTRAALESKRPGKYGTALAVAKPIAGEIEEQEKIAQERATILFKSKIEELAQERKQRFEARFDHTPFEDNNDAIDAAKKFGLPEDTFIPMVGLPFKDAKDAQDRIMEIRKKAAEEAQAEIQPTPEKKAAALVSPETAAKAAFPESSKAIGKQVPIADSTSSTGKRWAILGPGGVLTPTEFEAPKEAGGGSSPSLDPRKRQDALRLQFRDKVKDLQFNKYAEAYKIAIRAEKESGKNNPAADSRLLYGWAKMLQPTGVLSNQDFTTAAKIGSYGDDIKAAINKISQGRVMSDELRNRIVQEIKVSYKGIDQQLSQIEDEHKSLAEQEGLEFEKTISPVRPVIEDEFKSRIEVKAAYKNGTITKEKALELLKKFPE